MNNKIDPLWWKEEYGFFGEFYKEGDNSKEGYLISEKQTLEERTEKEVNGVIKLLELNPGSRVLDIPCGYGRHSNALAKKGFQVTGTDINKKFLDHAKVSASTAEFILINMKDIAYDDAFDAVINMFFSFGFFDTDEENFKCLMNMYSALKKNGKLLMHTDVNVPRITNGKYKLNEIRPLQSGKKLHINETYNENTKRIEGFWNIEQNHGKSTKKYYSQRVYTMEEFSDMCSKAGFIKTEAFGNWDGSPYHEKSEDMIIVAQK